MTVKACGSFKRWGTAVGESRNVYKSSVLRPCSAIAILLGCCSESGDKERLSLHTRNALEILTKDIVEKNDQQCN